jgi:hypothetical protein
MQAVGAGLATVLSGSGVTSAIAIKPRRDRQAGQPRPMALLCSSLCSRAQPHRLTRDKLRASARRIGLIARTDTVQPNRMACIHKGSRCPVRKPQPRHPYLSVEFCRMECR